MAAKHPGRPPTLEQVAARAGVSRATVSRVINGASTVDPALRKLVDAAITATGYVPNHAARAMVTRRTNSVALVISEPQHRAFPEPMLDRVFTDPFFGRMYAGALAVLRPQGTHLVLMMAEPPGHHHVLGYLRQGHVDGVLLISSAGTDPLPGELADLRIPAILSTRPARPVPLSYVDVDQRAAAELAAEHLAARGCRRPAIISGPLDMLQSQDRLEGFRAGAARHGHVDVPSTEGTFTRASGEQALHALFADHPDIDGVFAANDLMAEGALRALRDLGRRVPDDVAVVGFDDSSAALACRPQLTTVRQPVEEMAAEMARLLLAQIDDPSAGRRSVIFEPSLVVRESA